MNEEADDDDDSLGGEYPYATLSQRMECDANNNDDDSNVPVLGCLPLFLQGFMFCLLEVKTVCGDTINRRKHRNHDYYYTEEETKVSLLTESMEEDVEYASEQVVPTTTPQQVSNLDQAMKNFVETNDSQGLLQIFDTPVTSVIIVKDDKQD